MDSDLSTCYHATHTEFGANSATLNANGQAAYICPMCPGVESDGPAICPSCGMALEPTLRTSL